MDWKIRTIKSMLRIIYTFIFRFAEIVFGILILIMTSRLFGAEGRGLFSAGMVVATLFGTLGSINLSRGLYSDICSSSNSVDEYVKKLFSTIVALVTATSTLAVVAYSLVYFHSAKLFASMPPTFILLFALYVPCLIWTNVANTLYSSLGIINLKNNITLMVKTVFCAIVVLIYFYYELSLVLFCGLFVLSAVVNMIVEGALLKYRYVTEHSLDVDSVKRLTLKSIAWYPDLVGGYMISGAVSAIVVYYLSVKEVGIFGVAMQMFSIGFMLVPTVLQLYVSGDIAKNGPKKSIKSLFRYILYYSIYFVFAYIMLTFVGEMVVTRILGADFIDAVSVLKIIAIAGWISGVVLMLSPLWTAMHYAKFVTISTVLLGGISLLVLLYMTIQYNLYGAAWGMVFIYIIALIGNFFLLRYTLREFARSL